MFHGMIPEVILFALILVQLVLLGTSARGFVFRLFVPITQLGYVLALVAAVIGWRGSEGKLFYDTLSGESLISPLKISYLIAGFLLIRMLLGSTEVPETRKKEIISLFTLNTLFSLLLLFSENMLLSFLLLGAMGLLGSLLVGIPLFNRSEASGAQKSWTFSLAAICFGLGALGVLAVTAGGLGYDAIHKVFLAGPSKFSFLLLSLCLLPFFLVGGVFPFHFFAVDRDDAARWPIQAHLTIQVSSAVVIGLIHLLVNILSGVKYGEGGFGLSLISFFGLAGALWGAWCAFSQQRVKRFFAYMTLAAWSTILIPIGSPSPLALASAVFLTNLYILALAVLAWTMGRICERSKSDSFEKVMSQQHPRLEVGIFLMALSCLQVLPPFPGFPAFLHLLGACMERQSILLIFVFCSIFALFSLSSLRLYSGFTRQFLSREPSSTQYNIPTIDLVSSSLILLLLISLGVHWNTYFVRLVQFAKAFII